MFSYKNDALSTLLGTAAGDVNDVSAGADWHKVQDLIAAGMPTVPLLDAKSPVGARRYVMGFVGSGNRTEVLSTVWLNK
jgi:hypothetical protein